MTRPVSIKYLHYQHLLILELKGLPDPQDIIFCLRTIEAYRNYVMHPSLNHFIIFHFLSFTDMAKNFHATAHEIRAHYKYKEDWFTRNTPSGSRGRIGVVVPRMSDLYLFHHRLVYMIRINQPQLSYGIFWQYPSALKWVETGLFEAYPELTP